MLWSEDTENGYRGGRSLVWTIHFLFGRHWLWRLRHNLPSRHHRCTSWRLVILWVSLLQQGSNNGISYFVDDVDRVFWNRVSHFVHKISKNGYHYRINISLYWIVKDLLLVFSLCFFKSLKKPYLIIHWGNSSEWESIYHKNVLFDQLMQILFQVMFIRLLWYYHVYYDIIRTVLHIIIATC